MGKIKFNISKEELYDVYINQKKNITEVAKIYKLPHSTIWRWLQKYNIKTKSIKELCNERVIHWNAKNVPSKQILIDLYINQRKSLLNTSKILGYGVHKVAIYLRKYKIPIRSLSEARTGLKFSKQHRENLSKGKLGNKNPFYDEHHSKETKERLRTGENNGNWKGGITPLISQMQNSIQYKQWRLDVFKRDDYICQKCGKKSSGDLEAHHIKPRTKIIKENNIITLEEAINCLELWDIGNGLTLCEKCHDKIGHKWSNKGENGKTESG